MDMVEKTNVARGHSTDSNWRENLAGRSLFDELVGLRDAQRAEDEILLVRGGDVPVELSAWGNIQWYLHPKLSGTGTRALTLWVMTIDPGSRSGSLRCGGGHVYYVWMGTKGYTLVDGTRHDWGHGCVINLPIKSGGVVFQHANDGPDVVKLIGVEVNLAHTMGVDRAGRYEVVDACPEYASRQAHTLRS